MTKLEKNLEKHRVNTWKKRWKKMRTIVWVGTFAIWTTFMVGCGPDASNLTKLSKEHDAAVENITTQKDELKDAEEDLKDAQAKVAKEQQDVIDAQKKERELRKEVQTEKMNP